MVAFSHLISHNEDSIKEAAVAGLASLAKNVPECFGKSGMNE
jgi:hypothetical protein